MEVLDADLEQIKNRFTVCRLCEHNKTMNTETMILTFVPVVRVVYFLEFFGRERYDLG